MAPRKLWSYDHFKRIATVYHLGRHTCTTQLDTKTRNEKIKLAVADRNLRGPAKQVGIEQISQFVEEGTSKVLRWKRKIGLTDAQQKDN